MNKTIIEQFNERMLDLYTERDFYSRGRIIEVATEALADIVKNNSPLPVVIASAKDEISERRNVYAANYYSSNGEDRERWGNQMEAMEEAYDILKKHSL